MSVTSSREVLTGWGMAHHARSRVYRPGSVEEARRALADARDRGLTVAHRGAGQSYGDAALNQGGAVVMTGGLDRVLSFDPGTGRVRAEAGVTIDRLWREVLPEGWWPPVVPGTARPTLGGCLAMNVHGKNHPQAGSFGEHVAAVTVLRPDGEVERLEADDPAFDEVVGTQGLFGTILAMEIQLTRVESGYLSVEARWAADLGEAMEILDVLGRVHDYSVAWIDCFARGDALGRGELHAASYLSADHARAGEGLAVEDQEPSRRLFGVLPRSRLAGLMEPVVNDAGMRAVNAAKYRHARLRHPSRHLESHASFHFLLDHVPGWKRCYWPGGLVQYQFFVPRDEARRVFRTALERQREAGVISYLGVLKRHRPDPFPSNYSVDGYSLALDFPVRDGKLRELDRLLRGFDALQRDAGGAVYAAKDGVSTLGRLPEGRLPAFSSNLVRRWERSEVGRRLASPGGS